MRRTDDYVKLNEKEVALFQALLFYHPEGMTDEFDRLAGQLLEKLNFHPAVGKYTVWK